MSAYPRAVQLAVAIWCINLMCVIVNNIEIFHGQPEIGMNWALVNTTLSWGNITATSGIGAFGILLDFVNILNLFIQLILGPFILVPSILDIVGITGIMRIAIIAMVWIPWSIFLFGMITARALKEFS